MKYLAFDANFFCWRGFHSSGNMKYNGVETGAIQSFITAIYHHCKMFSISKPLFCFDSRKNYRKKIFPGYKDRPPANKQAELERIEIYKQITAIRKTILPDIGFKNIYQQTGIEADDIMAKLVRDNPHQIIVLTGDEDLLQLVDECNWYSPATKTLIDEKTFKEKYGISPEKWKIVKALAGCSSDKIPGIRGVGEKTILKYLTGQLGKNTIIYSNIEKYQLSIKQTNSILVDLPFPKTQSVTIQDDKFDPEGFGDVCERFGLKKLKNKVEEWEMMFK
jgi:5'-3' exonuclease